MILDVRGQTRVMIWIPTSSMNLVFRAILTLYLKPWLYMYTDIYLTIQNILTLYLKPWLYLYTDTYLTIYNILTLYLKPWLYMYTDIYLTIHYMHYANSTSKTLVMLVNRYKLEYRYILNSSLYALCQLYI